MKNKILLAIFVIIASYVSFSCTKILEEEVYSELSDKYLQTENGINTLVYQLYSDAHTVSMSQAHDFLLSSYLSGQAWGKGGSYETQYATIFKNFTWDANNSYSLEKWTELYTIIRDANLILDKLPEGDFSAAYVTLITAEAKGLRGHAYALLYDYFGAVPIFTSTYTDELERPRATEAEVISQIETDLTAAIPGLPVTASQYGRLTQGAALGFLCKYYLQTKQWQKCVDAAQDIEDLAIYGLKTNYADIFGVANEGPLNQEVIWAHTADPSNHPEMLAALNYPTDFPRPSNETFYATRTYWYDSFLDSFDAEDTRKDVFVTSYISTATGLTVQGYGKNQSLCNKFGTDPNAVSPYTGIDLPEIRLADILMSKAEALNELNGPTQASLDLIDLIRMRAGFTTPLNLADFTSKASLRDFILNERVHEFFMEGKDRNDLIRHGTFISDAVARGITNAQDYMILLPIPQTEIDANSQINENNPGY